MKPLRAITRYWPYVGILPGIVALAYVLIESASLEVMQAILLLQFMALAVHQFEEYVWPGGFPLMVNAGVWKSDAQLRDRYPLNQLASAWLNLFYLWLVYLPAALFYSDVTWLALLIAFIGIGELLFHLLAVPRATGFFYNPGLATSVLLFLPLGVWQIVEVISSGSADGMDWLWAALAAVFTGAGMIRGITFGLFASRDSQFPFPQDELMRGPMVKHLEPADAPDRV